MKNVIWQLFIWTVAALLAACGGGGGGGSSSGTVPSSSVALTPAGPPIVWTSKKPMPTPRTEFGVATVNNKVYAIGGYSGSVLRTVEVYDPASDTWTRKADMPTPRRQLVVAAVNNKIYAIGGVDFTSDPNNVTYSYATEEYDPGADTWTIKATMPAGGAVNGVLGNRFIGGAAANGKIYIAAYSNPGAPSLTHALEYNPSTDTWTSKASPPFTYSRYAVTSLNDKLYALSDLGLLAEYDPLKDYWILRLPTSTWRFWTGFTSAGGRLFSVGGGDGPNVVNTASVVSTVEEYDPTTQIWAPRASIGTARASLALAEVSGKIYAIGGSANTDASVPLPLVTMEEGTLPPPGSVLQSPTGDAVTTGNGQVTIRWNPVSGATSYNLYMASSVDLERSNYASLPDGAKFVGVTFPHTVTGLMNGKTYYFFVTATDVTRESEESFGTSAMPTAPPGLQWATKAGMPTPRLESGAATVNNKIYVIGGFSGSALHAVEEYDPIANTWTTKSDMPTARRSPVVMAVNNKIYAIGGMDYIYPGEVTYSYATEEYDPATNNWIVKTPMPAGNPVNSALGNRFAAGAVVNGKMYFTVFNNNGTPPIFSTFEYDPVTDVWNTNKAPVPFGINQFSVPDTAASLGGKLYVLNGSNTTSSFAEYTPATDTWTIKTSPPRNLTQARLVSVPAKNKLYAIGGVELSDVQDAVQEYDPVTNLWTTQASIPIPRHSAAITEAGGKVYAFGGSLIPESLNIAGTFIYTAIPSTDVEEGQ